MKLHFPIVLIIVYSQNASACAMESKGEEALAFFVYMFSAGLAIYAVFSRLTFSPKMFFVPLGAALFFGYLGLSEIGCVESRPFQSSLITLVGVTLLAAYETYIRKKNKKITTG